MVLSIGDSSEQVGSYVSSLISSSRSRRSNRASSFRRSQRQAEKSSDPREQSKETEDQIKGRKSDHSRYASRNNNEASSRIDSRRGKLLEAIRDRRRERATSFQDVNISVVNNNQNDVVNNNQNDVANNNQNGVANNNQNDVANNNQNVSITTSVNSSFVRGLGDSVDDNFNADHPSLRSRFELEGRLTNLIRDRRSLSGDVTFDDINIDIGNNINIDKGNNNEDITVNVDVGTNFLSGDLNFDDINIDLGNNNEDVTINIEIGTVDPYPIYQLTKSIQELDSSVKDLTTQVDDLTLSNEILTDQNELLTAEITLLGNKFSDVGDNLVEGLRMALDLNTTSTTQLTNLFQQALDMGFIGGGGGIVGPGVFGGGLSRTDGISRADNFVDSFTKNLSLQGSGGPFSGTSGGYQSGSNLTVLLDKLLGSLMGDEPFKGL